MNGGRVFFSCVEVSADLHAGQVARALAALDADAGVVAAGGDFLAASGAEVVMDTRGHAVMGLVEAARHLPFYHRLHRRALDYIGRVQPAAVVLVDAPAYHIRLGLALRARFPDLPILYYVPPKAWAWKPGRVARLARFVTRLLCIFPFEEDWYGQRGVPAVYVGNPTLDELRPVIARRESRPLAGAAEGPLPASGPWSGGGARAVAVFPGSRDAEIRRMWPLFSAAMHLLRERRGEWAFSVALAPGVEPARLKSLAPIPAKTTFVPAGESHALLARADFVLAKSGTTTLEAAFLGVPMIVAYRMNPLTAWAARFMVKRHLDHFALPNILAGRRIVPEFFQGEATPRRIAAEAGDLLEDHARYRRAQNDLVALRAGFGDASAGERAAEIILEEMG